MIAVIADDLSGATELASAAAEAGFPAEVQTGKFEPDTECEVVAITTGSRLPEPCLESVAEIAHQVIAAKPAWIFKKTDSVLRGHVAPEIAAILSITGLANALFVPANPGKGRTISQGAYFMGGVPLHQTPFARDPDFPRSTCDVVELARGTGRDDTAEFPVFWIGDAKIPSDRGIFLPEMTTPDQMSARAGNLDFSTTLPAGGVEFFQAILGSSEKSHNQQSPPSAAGSLFVCGSAAAWELGRRQDFEAQGIPVVPMPAELFANPGGNLEEWEAATIEQFSRSSTVAIAIGSAGSARSPESLTHPLARAASHLVLNGTVSRLFVEGGATASALIDRLGWRRFTVKAPFAAGLAELQPIPPAPCSICVKPGSYPWPAFP